MRGFFFYFFFGLLSVLRHVVHTFARFPGVRRFVHCKFAFFFVRFVWL